MAFTFGHTPIVTDGLVLYLDAGNDKSFISPSTPWNDLSRTFNPGVVYGSISHDGSSISTSSTSSYVQFSYTSSLADFSLGQTICFIIEPEIGASAIRRNFYNQAYGGPGTITHEPNYLFNYYFGTSGGNSPPYFSIGSGSVKIEPGERAFAACSRNQTLNRGKWYKNGIRSVLTSAGGYAATANGSNPIIIGKGYTSFFAGKIFAILVYNRELSEEEVLQVYNCFKSRYNI